LSTTTQENTNITAGLQDEGEEPTDE
jgi:hypothetical protein